MSFWRIIHYILLLLFGIIPTATKIPLIWKEWINLLRNICCSRCDVKLLLNNKQQLCNWARGDRFYFGTSTGERKRHWEIWYYVTKSFQKNASADIYICPWDSILFFRLYYVCDSSSSSSSKPQTNTKKKNTSDYLFRLRISPEPDRLANRSPQSIPCSVDVKTPPR